MIYKRGCLICGAVFTKETNEEILTNLEIHLNKCTKENPHKNDTNADYYEE